MVDDPQIIANKFNEFYSNDANNECMNIPQSDYSFRDFLRPADPGNINWELTNCHEVKRIVDKLNNVKHGPDKIPISIIKKNIDILSPILTHLCNLSLRTGIFPAIHKKGIITPLYKKNDKYDISNYRPICALNAMSKLLERIVFLRIINHLESKNLISRSQYAYRTGRSTEIAATKFVNDVLRGFDEGNYTIATFLD